MRCNVVVEHENGRTLIERRPPHSRTPPPAPRTRPPALPPLPAPAAERALVLETLAAAIVAQYGAEAALALASAIDEVVADVER